MADWTMKNFNALRDMSPRGALMQWKLARHLGRPARRSSGRPLWT